MRLGEHGKFLLDFVMSFSEGELARWEFDLDYSGYVIEHFPGFEIETPRLAAKFIRSVDTAYSAYGWMTDNAFALAISDALDVFLGTPKPPLIY